jgi:hypothetical protein
MFRRRFENSVIRVRSDKMDRERIERLQMLNSEIQNFKDCYHSCELWGDRDEAVAPERLISFLIENPHFQQMADKIKKLDV